MGGSSPPGQPWPSPWWLQMRAPLQFSRPRFLPLRGSICRIRDRHPHMVGGMWGDHVGGSSRGRGSHGRALGGCSASPLQFSRPRFLPLRGSICRIRSRHPHMVGGNVGEAMWEGAVEAAAAMAEPWWLQMRAPLQFSRPRFLPLRGSICRIRSRHQLTMEGEDVGEALWDDFENRKSL